MKKFILCGLLSLSCTHSLHSFSVPSVTTLGVVFFVVHAILRDTLHVDCPDGNAIQDALSEVPWTAGGC